MQTDAEKYLEQAQLNPVYIECIQSLRKGNLKEYLTETPNLKRLMLQKTRSFSRRAMAISDNEKITGEVRIVEGLACGFMAAEKNF